MIIIDKGKQKKKYTELKHVVLENRHCADIVSVYRQNLWPLGLVSGYYNHHHYIVITFETLYTRAFEPLCEVENTV